MKKILLVPFIFTLLLTTSLKSQDLSSDSTALMAIYNACGGPNWANANWSSPNLADWTGVRIDDGRVVFLDLDRQNLINEIPDDIYDLTGLEILRLRDTEVVFNITDQLANLTELVEINIFMQNASIASYDVLCEMPNLVDLRFNSISGPDVFPDCLFEKPLTDFGFLNMDFGGQPLPEGLGNIPTIRGINVINSNFGGELPLSLCNEFDNWRFLILSDNDFSGTTLPSCLPMPSFNQFILTDCGFEGDFNFDGIGDQMSILRCDGNHFTGNLDTLQDIFSVGSFEFDDSQLTGTLDADRFGRDQIVGIEIPNNNVTGLVNWQGEWERLNTFDVWGNRLNFADLESVDLDFEYNYAPQQNLSADTTINLTLGSSVVLDCDAGGANTTYQWFRNNAMISGENNPTLELNNLSMDDQGDYFCEANNADFPDLTLSTGVTTIDFSSSTGDQFVNALDVFPNPASEYLLVDFQRTPDKITIVNIKGQEINAPIQVLANQIRINLSDFNSGIYFLQVESDGVKNIDKFQVIK